MALYFFVIGFLICLLAFSYRVSKKAIVSSYYYIYYFAFALVSAFVIENGAYMLEVERYGRANGTFLAIAIFFAIGLVCIVIGYSAHEAVFRSPVFYVRYRKVESIVAYLFLWSSGMVALYVYAKYSGPLFLGVERFEFWNNIVPSSLAFSKSLITQAFFFVPMLLVLVRKRLVFFVVVIFWVAITVLVLGEKFTAFQYYLTIGGLYLAVLFERGAVKGLPLFKVLLLAVLMAVLVALVYEKSGYGFSFIVDRVALQSQLTWLVVEDSIVMNSLAGAADALDQTALSSARYDNYRALGIGLTGYNPAVHISVFGFFGGIFLHCFACFCFGLIQAEIVGLINKGAVVHGFVVFKLYIAFLFFWMTSDPSHVYGFVNFLCVLILFVGVFLKLSLRFRETPVLEISPNKYG